MSEPVASDARLAEARRSQRLPSKMSMTLVLELEGKKVRYKGRLVDVSTLGVRVRSGGALAAGQSVELILTEGSWNVYPCRVVWVGATAPESTSDAGLEYKTPWTAVRRARQV
jgi:PilZ domain-containing protein